MLKSRFFFVESKKPGHVRVPEAFFDAVWVFIGIRVSMVHAVVGGPFCNAALIICSTKNGKQSFDKRSGLVAFVRK